MARRWRHSSRLRTVTGTVAAIGAGLLLAPVAGLAGCSSSTAPPAASHTEGGTESHTEGGTGNGTGSGTRSGGIVSESGGRAGYRPPMSSLQISG